MQSEQERVEETLVEMAYRWSDIERAFDRWHRGEGEKRREIGTEVSAALDRAFRVEASSESGEDEYNVRISEQERQRRSELARRLHREGRLGTRAHQSKGGKATARRASQLAARLIEENHELMSKTLREIMRNGTPSQKLRATEALLKIGLSAERLEVTEHRDEQVHHSREELLEILRSKLTSGPAAAILQGRLADVDGTAVEIR